MTMARQQWEYMELENDGETCVESLNRAGKHGWELVAAIASDVTRRTTFYLKRPVEAVLTEAS